MFRVVGAFTLPMGFSSIQLLFEIPDIAPFFRLVRETVLNTTVDG